MRGLWRVLDAFCGWLLILATLIGAAAAYVLILHRIAREHVAAVLTSPAYEAQRTRLGSAVLLLCIALLLIAMIRLRSRRTQAACLDVPMTDGVIRISSDTVARLVRGVAIAGGDVSNACVTTRRAGRKIDIFLRVTLTDETPVALRASLLQASIRQRIRDVFGVDIVRDVTIEIAGVEQRSRRGPRLLGWHADAAPPAQPPPGSAASAMAAPSVSSAHTHG